MNTTHSQRETDEMFKWLNRNRQILFSFVLRNGQWELSSDQLLNVPSPPTKADEKSVPVDPSVTPADPLAPQTYI
ncbi:MAG: hypothetical protein V7K77_28030 [Nostoc sp.]|uniref:hypothetical protein n=1 Tax=Nostoc sp. TaxID=1180 RepID=UPI002FFB20E9